MGVSIRGRTRVLEKLRIVRSPTRLRTVVMVPTAKFISTKSLTATLTTHHMTRR